MSAETISLLDQQSYYDEFWINGVNPLNPSNLARLSKILDAIQVIALERQSKAFQSICDFGCGTGWLSNYLSAFGPTIGVDLSSGAIQAAAQRYPNIQFETANILDWKPNRIFDLVVSSEVIEHVEGRRKSEYINTIKHITAPGSTLILTTPNRNVKRYWDRAMGSGNSGQIIEDWLNPSELKRLLSEDFYILHHDTFYLDFSYSGMMRVLSARKFRSFLTTMKLQHIYDSLRVTASLGLYQILLARRR